MPPGANLVARGWVRRHTADDDGRGVLLALTDAGDTAAARLAEARRQRRAARQAEVAERGASVMPFDLERTTHRFVKTAEGGVQTVVADNPADTTQVDLIRGHLRYEAGRFRQGLFTDPAQIHGQQMPGLAALRESAGRIDVAYTDTPDGARVTYTTDESALVTALHTWFDAQVSDHGSHVSAG